MVEGALLTVSEQAELRTEQRLQKKFNAERRKAEAERRKAEAERRKADAERRKAEAERREKLRQKGWTEAEIAEFMGSR